MRLDEPLKAIFDAQDLPPVLVDGRLHRGADDGIEARTIPTTRKNPHALDRVGHGSDLPSSSPSCSCASASVWARVSQHVLYAHAKQPACQHSRVLQGLAVPAFPQRTLASTRSCPDNLSPQRTRYHLGVAKSRVAALGGFVTMEDFTEPVQRLALPQRSSGETRAATRHSHFHLGAHSPCTAGAVRAPPRGGTRSAARSYPCHAGESCSTLSKEIGRHASAPRCSLTNWSMSGSWLPAWTDAASMVAV